MIVFRFDGGLVVFLLGPGASEVNVALGSPGHHVVVDELGTVIKIHPGNLERNHLNSGVNGVTDVNMGVIAHAVSVDSTGENVRHVEAASKLAFQARPAVGDSIHFEKPWYCFDFVACFADLDGGAQQW